MKYIFILLQTLVTLQTVSAQFNYASTPNSYEGNSISSLHFPNIGNAIINNNGNSFRVAVTDGFAKMMAWNDGAGHTGTIALPQTAYNGLTLADDDPDVILTRVNGNTVAFVVKMDYASATLNRIVIKLFWSKWNNVTNTFPAFTLGQVIGAATWPCMHPNIDDDGTGNFVVTWQSGQFAGSVYLRKFACTSVSPFFSASPNTEYNISNTSGVQNFFNVQGVQYNSNKFSRPDVAISSSGVISVAMEYGGPSAYTEPGGTPGYHNMFVYQCSTGNISGGSIVYDAGFTGCTYSTYFYGPRIASPNNSLFPNDFGVCYNYIIPHCGMTGFGNLITVINHDNQFFYPPVVVNCTSNGSGQVCMLPAYDLGVNNRAIAVSDNYYQVAWCTSDDAGYLNATPHLQILSKKYDFYANAVSDNFSVLSSDLTVDIESPAIASIKNGVSDKFSFGFVNETASQLAYKTVSDGALNLRPSNIYKGNTVRPDYLNDNYYGKSSFKQDKNLGNVTRFIKPGSGVNKIYPNPALSEIVIDMPDNITGTTITILNTFGQIVKTFRTNQGKSSINISDIANGTYWIRTVSGNSQSQEKLIIAR